METRNNRNVVYRTSYHVVWCTKYRRDVLTDDVQKRLISICKKVCDEKGAVIEELEAMADHFHLLVSVDPQYGIHKLVKTIKGRSSRLIRQEFPHCRTRLPSLWTNSYFVATIGGAPLKAVKEYVRNQKSV